MSRTIIMMLIKCCKLEVEPSSVTGEILKSIITNFKSIDNRVEAISLHSQLMIKKASCHLHHLYFDIIDITDLQSIIDNQKNFQYQLINHPSLSYLAL